MSLRRAPAADFTPMDLPRELADAATALDAANPLAALRPRFTLPVGVAYLDGNSLGALPAHVPARLAQVVAEQWGQDLIASWDAAGWWTSPERVGDRVAPLIGAAPGQTVVLESTTVALFKAVHAAADLAGVPAAGAGPGVPGQGGRLLLTDAASFPTDLYLLEEVARSRGLELRTVPVPELAGTLAREGERVAATVLSAVDYRSGERWDLPGLTAAAHQQGGSVVWDLCHAAGAMECDVDVHQVDLAVGCGYKFLNGGPGAPAWLYAARRHHDRLRNPLPGWHGHADPFGMHGAYRAGAGVRRMRTGTPPILSTLALDAALDVFDGVPAADLRRASVSLTSFFLEVLTELAPSADTPTPLEPRRRGSQVSLRHPDAAQLTRRLAEAGVVGDHRPPDLVRLGFAPAYTSHAEALRAAATYARLTAG